MTETVKKQWVIYRQRLSKGDMAFEVEEQVFACENEARECFEALRAEVSPCWPDFDDYDLREKIA